MPTKYDVFAKVIEKGPCKESALGFQSEVYVQLKELVSRKWVKVKDHIYSPIKNKESTSAFNIIKYSIKNNLDYNIFFSKNIGTVITELSKNIPNTRPQKLRNNKDILGILTYLEDNQFILTHSKRPARGLLLRHQLFEHIIGLCDLKIAIQKANLSNQIVETKIKELRSGIINPFDDNVFSFLSGSAQLEGATISIGETRELIVKDIYPDKPQKDIQMVKNLNEAFHYVLDHIDEKITPEHISQINYLVMFSMHRNAGKYKKTQNKIHGNPDFKTASPVEVPLLVERYCKRINELDNLDELGYIHNELQYIHPFADGNSRTIRMVLNWYMMKHSYPMVILKMGCFDEYMKLTKLNKKRDDKELTRLFWNVLVHENM